MRAMNEPDSGETRRRDDAEATAPDGAVEDPAQAEWERTEAVEEGATQEELDGTTATGRDPDEFAAADDVIPGDDPHGDEPQPESQGEEILLAEVGDDGEGDLSPEDV